MLRTILMSSCASAILLLPAPAQRGGDDRPYAPPPIEVDGLTGVPIDIKTLDARVVFDIESKQAIARAELVFQMTAKGMPLFDVRQDIEAAILNGEEIDVSKMAAHEVSPTGGTMRILERELAADQDHVLVCEYALQQPRSPRSIPIAWGDGTVGWDLYFSDLNPGRYMEMWFPSNLLYDSFGCTMELQIVGADDKHHLVTNADVETVGEHHWKLTFPDSYTAFSHMVVLVPADEVERTTDTVKLKSGKEIAVEVVRRKEAGSSNKKIHDMVENDLVEFSQSMGDWPHGDRCAVYIWTGGRSMEYDGATTTAIGALRHELFHSWWGRGIKPMSQNDGWWDEAWNVYASERRPPRLNSRDEKAAPLRLSSSDPYNRTTPGSSYGPGAKMFARIAAEIGDEKLRELMTEFYTKHTPHVASTQMMEAYLAEHSKSDAVRQIFHRYVYGKEGEPPQAKD